MHVYRNLLRFCFLVGALAASASAQGVTFTTSPQLPPAILGEITYLDFALTGGNGTYSVALVNGTTFPPGFSLNQFQPTQVYGTPTQTGVFNFTLIGSDSSGAQTAPQQFTLTVGVDPAGFRVLPTGSLNGAVVGQPYTAVYAQGGTPNYTWTLKYGKLPPGLSLTTTPTPGQDPKTGLPTLAISGTPTTAGTFSFTLQVTDSATPNALTVTPTYTISVVAPNQYNEPLTYPTNGQNSLSTQPLGIAATANALWFTQRGGTIYGDPTIPKGAESITVNGKFHNETPLPTNSAFTPSPYSITVGPDGNTLWATDLGGYIYSLTPPGSGSSPATIGTPVSLVTNTAVLVQPTGITSGGDGGVWFTGFGADGHGYVGRLQPGQSTPVFYQIPSPIVMPASIIQGPDGNLWYLAQAQAGPGSSTVVVGSITTGGTFVSPKACATASKYPQVEGCVILDSTGAFVPPGGFANGLQNPGPNIIVGADSALWFATGKIGGVGGYIGRIATDGSDLSLFPIPFPVASMALGSDKSIWFTGGQTLVYRISTSGQVTNFDLNPGGSTGLEGIVAGPDGALWMTDYNLSVIYQIFPTLALDCNVSGTLQVGVPIQNASCAAFGGKSPYTYSFDKSNLPPGVTASPDGVLSGTPTAPGSFIITATDNSSPAQEATQVIAVAQAPAIQLTCTFPATATAGQAYSGSCLAAGGNSPYTYTVTPGLPGGLTGTPTVPSGSNSQFGFSVSGTLLPTDYGTASFTITALDSSQPTPNTSSAVQVSIAITPTPVAISCNPNALAVVNTPFQQTCYGVMGAPPYSFTATGLPTGLTMSTSGLISGTPTALGSSTATVVLTDAAGQTATESITVTVTKPKLALVCNITPPLKIGANYTLLCPQPALSGLGTAPYTYSVAAGTLPAGLTLNTSTGTVSGTPTTSGGGAFTLQVTDSESPAATAQWSTSFFVGTPTLTILTTALPNPNGALPYAVVPIVEGGIPPYTFAITSGALPTGLALDSKGGTLSTASGTTLATGTFNFTYQATDSSGATASQAYALTIVAPLAPSFASIALPTASGANGITVGPDGALWFTTIDQVGGNLIGRVTTAGVVTTVASANPLTMNNPSSFELVTGGDIVAGPDGAIWIAQRDGNAIGQLSTDLSSQRSHIPTTPNSGPAQIVAAPDGALWFTEAAASQIGRVDASGSLVEQPTPTPGSSPAGIAVGQNVIVFTEPATNKIGYVSLDGSASGDFALPTPARLPTSIVLGPDNAFWFTEFGANQIGRIDYNGNVTEFPVSSAPQAIATGQDGALYFTETAGNIIGRITVIGAVTEFKVTDANSGPVGLVTGPDGSIWFTENNLSKIGRLSFIPPPTVTCTVPPGPLQAGSTYSGTCTATGGTPPYQFSATGATPPGITLDPNTGAVSGTLTAAGTFAFAISVTDSSTPPFVEQTPYTLTVTPLPLGVTCNTPIARLYTPYSPTDGSTAAFGCTGTNGTTPYSYAITSGTLPAGLSLDAASGNITGTPTSLGSYPFTLTVTDTSTPPMVVNQSVTMSVQYGTITGTGKPLFTLSSPPVSASPGSTAPGLTLTVNEQLLSSVTGSAVLTFQLASSIPTSGTLGKTYTTPPDYVDPALQFVDGSGKQLTATYNFTFPAGTGSITLPGIDVGTVLGNVVVTVNAAGVTQTATSFPVTGVIPIVEPGSVQFTNVTSSGFDVEFVAIAPSRTATYATITFNPASGNDIVGQETFVFDVTSISNEWFASDDGLKYGGRYSLTFPFQFSGTINSIASATVMLSVGSTNSPPVTGNR